MKLKLEYELESILKEFRKKALSEIKAKKYPVSVSPTKNSLVPVTKHSIKNALKKICPPSAEMFSKDLITHFQELQKFIPFCSSTTSFQSSWELRSESLNKYTADRLVNEGAQLIPENAISERIFPQIDERGVALGINRRLIAALRHSKGNYDDRLSGLGVFSYQPPLNVPGMLRYRWCEFLSKKLKFSYVLIVVMRLKYEISEGKKIHIFIIAPGKIIRPGKNLKDLSRTLKNPLQLQIVNRSEAYSSLNLLDSLDQSSLKIKIRQPLPEYLEERWAYGEINNSRRGKIIKKWYKENRKKCPGCEKLFADLTDSKIAFGHIISRDWASIYPHHQSSVHHPDNLYLTCKSCNSSLGNSFPNKNQTSQNDIEVEGTIGDWVRKIQLSK